MRGFPVTTTIPEHLFKYVEGLAEIHRGSLSKALGKIVEEHFEAAAQKLKKGKKNADR